MSEKFPTPERETRIPENITREEAEQNAKKRNTLKADIIRHETKNKR